MLALLGLATPVSAADWLENYEEALALAQKENKPILVNFTGSDWCGWCMRLDKEVFATVEFSSWASARVVLLKLDFPRTKPQSQKLWEQNKQLAGDFGVRGFPTILLLNPDGTPKAQTGYRQGGVAAYLQYLDGLLER